MKVNKAIFLTYANASNATAQLNVNFPVKSIHIKSIAYSAALPTPANTQLYVTIFSDLTNGEPIGSFYNDTTYSAQQFCDISFQPSTTETIIHSIKYFVPKRSLKVHH